MKIKTRSNVLAAAQFGLDGKPVEIECDITSGLPGFIVVGLGSKAVAEARERIRSAIKNSRLLIPPRRITFNMAPADLPKEGTSYDVSLAVALLEATGQLRLAGPTMFVGELSLDGSLRPIPAVITAAKLAVSLGLKQCFVPQANAEAASLVQGIQVLPAANLRQIVAHLRHEALIRPVRRRSPALATKSQSIDFGQIKGQTAAKRALMIAVAGGHNVRMIGPPGSGKSLLASAASGLQPPLRRQQSLEAAHLLSLAQPDSQPTSGPPYRAPHHGISTAALVGGGSQPRPGEISLSHHGILFLDELPEFKRETLEALRQPLEQGQITIGRTANTVTYPARFILITAQNPCPCGHLGDAGHDCRCTLSAIARYRSHLSGPLLDRIDLHVEVGRLSASALAGNDTGLSTNQMAEQVARARERQAKRQGDQLNSQLSPTELELNCQIELSAKEIATKAIEALGLSGRGYMRSLAVARTIADLDQSEVIKDSHLLEALHYRLKA